MRLRLGGAAGVDLAAPIPITPWTRVVIIALMVSLCSMLGAMMDLTVLVISLGLANIGIIVFLLLGKDITWGFVFYLTTIIFFHHGGLWIRLPSFPDLYPGRIASILLYLVFLGQILTSMRHAPRLGKIEKTMIMFLTVLFISVVTAGHRPQWLVLLRAYIYPFLFFYFARAVITQPSQVRIILTYFAAVGIYFGVMGIFEKLGLYQLIWPRFIVDAEIKTANLARLGFRVRGVFLQPAVLGAVMTMGFFPAWHYLSRIKGLTPKVAKLTLVVVTLPTLFFTQTRSVYAGFGLALVNTAIWSRRLRALCVTVLLAAGVAVFLNWDGVSSEDRDMGGMAVMSTVHYRIIIMYEAAEVFMDHPFFGCGFMNFQDLAKDYRKPRDVPFFGTLTLGMQRSAVSHNILMTVFAEQGLLGIIPFFLIFVFFFRNSLAAYRTLPRDGLISRDFVVCVWAAMIAYFVNGMFMEMRYFEYINVLFYFLMGMMSGIAEGYVAGLEEQESANRAGRPRLAVVTAEEGAR